MPFENRVPEITSSTVNTGQTTRSLALVTQNGVNKHKFFLDHVSLGAAGYLMIKSGATVISQRFLFPAKGTYYVGQVFEQTTVNSSLTLDAVLDSTSDGTIVMEASGYTEQLPTGPS